MPHDHAAHHHVLLVEHRLAHLPRHLPQRLLRHLGIVGRQRVLPRAGHVQVLEVRQVDLYLAPEHLQRLQPLVPAAIPDHRHRHGLFLDRLDDRPRERRAGDQVDVVRLVLDQPVEHLPQLALLQLAPKPLVTDMPVLAVDASQRAPAEEHRARPARAADARLLVKVQRRPRHHRVFAQAAEAPAGLPARHVTFSRAQLAVKHDPTLLFFPRSDIFRFRAAFQVSFRMRVRNLLRSVRP